MQRIKHTYTSARNKDLKYEYKYGIPWAILLLVSGYLVGNIIGEALIIMGILVSLLLIWLNRFWLFVIYLAKPKR